MKVTLIAGFDQCDHGVYRVYWKTGGSSVASVGSDYAGSRWIAPSNWTCEKGENPTTLISSIAHWIEKMEKLT